MGNTWNYLDITALGRREEWGGLTAGLPADAALLLVELPRPVRRNPDRESTLSREATQASRNVLE
jgi:hypothetical protein